VKMDRAARTADLIRRASHRMPTRARKRRRISQPIRAFVACRVAAVPGPCGERVTGSEHMCAAQERRKITDYTGAGENAGITATGKNSFEAVQTGKGIPPQRDEPPVKGQAVRASKYLGDSQFERWCRKPRPPESPTRTTTESTRLVADRMFMRSTTLWD